MSINIPISFPGADEAAAAADRAAASLDDVSTATSKWAKEHTELSQQSRELVGRIDASVQSVFALARAFDGPQDSLVPKMRAVTEMVGTLAPMFGPTGQLVGGIVQLAGRVIPELLEALMGIPERQEEVAESTRDATDAIREQGEAAETASESLDEFLGSVSTSARAREFAVAGEQIAMLTDRMMRLRDSARAIDQLEARELAAQIAELNAAAAIQGEQVQGEQRETRRGSGRDRIQEEAERQEDLRQRSLEIEDAYYAQLDALREEQKRADDELRAYELEQQQAMVDAELRAKAALEQADDERRERELAKKEADREAEDARVDEARQQAEEISGHAMSMMQELGGAIAEVVIGSKSAEDAFSALLASFLESISEQAALSAIREFAEGIASFARYDYSGGALHFAAGAAFAAVAVAAGAGSVALSAQSAPAKPSGPEERDSGGGARGDVNVFINSPMVTAQTRAELGRELRSTIAAADGF